jgi:hypothetical protein
MSAAPLVLVALQCVWSIVAGVAVGVMWRFRRDGMRSLERARKLHEETEAHLAQCTRALAAAKRAGVDLDAYMHDA